MKTNKLYTIVLAAIFIGGAMTVMYFGLQLGQSTDKPTTQSGAIIGESTQQDDTIEKMWGLKNLTPVTRPTFSVQTDYTHNIILVYLSEPLQQSKQEFLTWMKDQGFADLPQDDFQFVTR